MEEAHHDQQLRLGQDRPCEAQQLPLADRESIAALADGRVQLLRKLLQSLLHLRLLQCVPHLVVGVLLERVDVLRAAPQPQSTAVQTGNKDAAPSGAPSGCCL